MAVTEKSSLRDSRYRVTFDDLYSTYYPAIYRFAFRMMGNAEDARDIVQETFVRLYMTMESGSEIIRPKAWLYRVSANLCMNRLKRDSRYREILADQSKMTSHRSASEEELVRNEQLDLIRSHICTLPDKERTLLMLYQDGLSYAEMAWAINVKASSLGTMLSRAIAKLAHAIRDGRKS